MIQSREKNQNIINDVISEFCKENEVSNYILMKFAKKLIKAMLNRAEDNDCYFIDMLEDIDRIGRE